MVASGRGASAGILIKNAAALEQAEKITILAVDKTGTLTCGKPVLSQLLPLTVDRDEALALAAGLEQGSEHPLARAILDAAQTAKLSLPVIDEFRAIPGRGVEGSAGGRRLRLSAVDDTEAIGLPAGTLTDLQQAGNTLVVLSELQPSRSPSALAVLAIADPLRASSPAAVSRLRTMGIRLVMLTGDQQATAAAIAAQAGIADFRAGVLPGDKATQVAALKISGDVVAMVGDGINDAPALAAADVSFAIGAGSDAAIEVADMTLVRGDLHGIADAILLSRATLRKIRQNLFCAFIYNVLGIPLAALGMLSPVIAGAAMAMSSVSVVSNSLLLRRWRPGKT